jgi:hypothetical protein
MVSLFFLLFTYTTVPGINERFGDSARKQERMKYCTCTSTCTFGSSTWHLTLVQTTRYCTCVLVLLCRERPASVRQVPGTVPGTSTPSRGRHVCLLQTLSARRHSSGGSLNPSCRKNFEAL